MVKTWQGWVLLSPLELLAAEAMGGVTSALAVGRVASASAMGGVAGGRCDIIRGYSKSGHMANGGRHIVGNVLRRVGDLGGGGSPFRVAGT
eukprot:g15657.t1